MSHDIMPGLVGGATAVAPPGQTGSAATGPPGDAGLSALFASLLAGSGGQGAKTSVLPETQAGSLPALKGPSEKRDPKAAPGSLPIFPPPALPIKLNPGVNPVPDQMRPTPPPTAAGTAETQNAMDTSPVSGPRTKAETKPGGELPLPETRTNPSVALPAPPVLLIVAPPAPTVVTPAVPAAAPSARAVASSAAPSAMPMLAAQALPSASVAPLSNLAAMAPGAAAVTPLTLPQTFTLPGAAKPTVAGDAPLVRPAVAGADGPPERAAPPVFARLASAAPSPEPYTLTGRALTVPTAAVAAQPSSAAQPTAVVKAAEASVVADVVTKPTLLVASGLVPVQPLPLLSATSSTPEKTSPASLPAQTASPAGTPATAATAGIPTPVVISLSADPPTLMLPATALPAAQGTKAELATKAEADTKAVDDGAGTTEGASSLPALPVGAAKISLKTVPVPADNNTRTQAATTVKNGDATLPSESIAKPSERTVSEAGKDAGPIQDAALVLPQTMAPAPAAPAQPSTPLTQAERAEVIRQVADTVGTMPTPAQPGTSSQMTLQLHPKDWGQLQISVRITPAAHADTTSPQTVTAHVIAASPQIKAALENGSSDLRHALRQAGLHLDRLTVTVQAPEAGAKPGTASSGGHHLMNGGGGGQSQTDSRPSGTAPQPGTASFASFAGSSQGGHPGGQRPAPQAAPPGADATTEEPTTAPSAPRRPASGQVDMRA